MVQFSSNYRPSPRNLPLPTRPDAVPSEFSNSFAQLITDVSIPIIVYICSQALAESHENPYSPSPPPPPTREAPAGALIIPVVQSIPYGR